MKERDMEERETEMKEETGEIIPLSATKIADLAQL